MAKETRVKRYLIILFSLAMLVVTAGCAFFQYHAYHAPVTVQQNEYPTVAKKHYNYSIDQVSKRNSQYDYVAGWVTVPGIEVVQYHTQLVLYQPGESQLLAFKTQMVERPDVTKHINDKLSHDASGFEAVIPKKYLKNGQYRIGFLASVGKQTQLFKTGVQYRLSTGGNKR